MKKLWAALAPDNFYTRTDLVLDCFVAVFIGLSLFGMFMSEFNLWSK
jgi:hypothetical protein